MLFIIHTLFRCGAIFYVETQIYREENEQLINNLKEGVVIIDQRDGKVRLINKAAEYFNIEKNKDLSMSINDMNDQEQIKFDKNQKILARIDHKLLNNDQIKAAEVTK